MPKISQKIESKSNFKLWKIFHARIYDFWESKCHFICSKDVFIRCGYTANICSVSRVYVHKPMYTCMWSRLWDLENEIDFLVVLYFCFIKRHVETVTFLPKLVHFFQMVKYLFFSRYNEYTHLSVVYTDAQARIWKLIDRNYF